MTVSRAIQFRNQLKTILQELKNDDDRYLVYHVSGLVRAISDFDYLIDHAEGESL